MSWTCDEVSDSIHTGVMFLPSYVSFHVTEATQITAARMPVMFFDQTESKGILHTHCNKCTTVLPFGFGLV